MRKKYNLIFSLGEACSCTHSLREAGLQKASYPFDWLYGSNFIERLQILISGFNRFFDKSDLDEIIPNTPLDRRAYINTYNKLVFNPDFIGGGMSLENSYTQVYDKYQRRISRLLNAIMYSDNTLIVYLEMPCCDCKITNDEIKKGFDLLKNRYPNKNIDLLYIRNDEALKKGSFTKELLNPNIIKLTGNYKSFKKNAYNYDIDIKLMAKTIASVASLNTSIYVKTKSVIMKTVIFLVILVPFKSWRKCIRSKLHKIKY